MKAINDNNPVSEVEVQWRPLVVQVDSLTHFNTMSHFYTSWKLQKTYGFLTFFRGLEMWHWTKMGWSLFVEQFGFCKYVANGFWHKFKSFEWRHFLNCFLFHCLAVNVFQLRSKGEKRIIVVFVFCFKACNSLCVDLYFLIDFAKKLLSTCDILYYRCVLHNILL